VYVFVPSQFIYVPPSTGVDAASVTPQTSLTTGSEVGGTAAEMHGTIAAMETGPPTSLGAVVCLTVKFLVAVAVLEQASVAVNVTVTV
jgi:hypothetical protein